MSRLRQWLRRHSARQDLDNADERFDREHAERLNEAAQLVARQREIQRRLRAMGIEVDVIQRTGEERPRP